MSKLILGTVQFGLNYGINNSAGKPRKDEIFEILDYAYNNAIKILDTADAYGNAVDVIGEYHKRSNNKFDIITKFKIGENRDFSLSKIVEATLKRLNVKQIWGYLFHSFDDYAKYDYIINELIELRNANLFQHIGVSIYTNEEFEQIIEDSRIDIIQLPYNLLDNLYLRGDLMKKAKDNNKIIHTRSAFLQGLFFKDINSFPQKLKPLVPYVVQLQKLATDNQLSMANLALNYPVLNEYIDNVLIGVDNLEQLKSNISSIEINSIAVELMHKINKIKVEEQNLLHPSNW